MSRSTVAAAKAELYALLWTANTATATFSVAGVDAAQIHVYDHEPRGGEMVAPVSVTISTAGFTPDFWVLAVRIYTTTQKYDAKKAQDVLDLLIPAVDAKVGSNGGFGPSDWTIEWDDGLEAFMATNLLQVGRQDYY